MFLPLTTTDVCISCYQYLYAYQYHMIYIICYDEYHFFLFSP